MLRDADKFGFSIAGYSHWLLTLDGISAAKDPIEYADAVAPSGSNAARAFLAGPTPEGAPNSGCMVFQLGALENFFAAYGKATPLRSPVGRDRWHVGTKWASANGALLAPAQWEPEEGDIVLCAEEPHSRHWLGLGRATGPDRWDTVEAGYRLDGPFQCVGMRSTGFARSPWRRIEIAPGAPATVRQIIRVRTLIERAA